MEYKIFFHGSYGPSCTVEVSLCFHNISMKVIYIIFILVDDLNIGWSFTNTNSKWYDNAMPKSGNFQLGMVPTLQHIALSCLWLTQQTTIIGIKVPIKNYQTKQWNKLSRWPNCPTLDHLSAATTTISAIWPSSSCLQQKIIEACQHWIDTVAGIAASIGWEQEYLTSTWC